jgi:hypothetical protein
MPKEMRGDICRLQSDGWKLGGLGRRMQFRRSAVAALEHGRELRREASTADGADAKALAALPTLPAELQIGGLRRRRRSGRYLKKRVEWSDTDVERIEHRFRRSESSSAETSPKALGQSR